MAINEQEIIQVFRTLSSRFNQVHHPAIVTMWNDVQKDINTLASELVGADVTVLENLVKELSPLVTKAIQAFEHAGPALATHASNLEGAFGRLQL